MTPSRLVMQVLQHGFSLKVGVFVDFHFIQVACVAQANHRVTNITQFIFEQAAVSRVSPWMCAFISMTKDFADYLLRLSHFLK